MEGIRPSPDVPEQTPIPAVSADLTVVRNGYVLAATAMGTSVLGIAFWALAARGFSTADVGRSSAAITTLTLVGSFAGLNLAGSYTYLIPRLQTGARAFVAKTYWVTSLLAVVLATGVVAFFSWRRGSSGSLLSTDPVFTVIFVIAAPATVLFVLQDGVLTGLRKPGLVLVENLVFASGKLAALAVLIVVAAEHGIFYAWVGASLVVVPAVTILLFARLLPRTAPEAQGESVHVLPETRRFIGLQYGGFLLSQIYLNLLPLIVLMTLGGTANGLFFVPWVIASAVDMLSHSMSSSLTVEGARDPALLREHVRHIGLRLAVLIGGGGMLGLIVAPVVLAVFGPEYEQGSVDLLRLLIVGAMFRSVVIVAQGAARALGRTSITLLTEAVTCAVVLAVTFAFLVPVGIEAVGWAWLIANVVTAALAVLSLKRVGAPHTSVGEAGHMTAADRP
jgi:O-antigen/teichoic acid export membrane protein